MKKVSEDAVKDFAAAVHSRDAAQRLSAKLANGEAEPREARAVAAYVEKLFMFMAEFVPAEVKREHALRNGKTGEGEGVKRAPRRQAPAPPSPRFYA